MVYPRPWRIARKSCSSKVSDRVQARVLSIEVLDFCSFDIPGHCGAAGKVWTTVMPSSSSNTRYTSVQPNINLSLLVGVRGSELAGEVINLTCVHQGLKLGSGRNQLLYKQS